MILSNLRDKWKLKYSPLEDLIWQFLCGSRLFRSLLSCHTKFCGKSSESKQIIRADYASPRFNLISKDYDQLQEFMIYHIHQLPFLNLRGKFQTLEYKKLTSFLYSLLIESWPQERNHFVLLATTSSVISRICPRWLW